MSNEDLLTTTEAAKFLATKESHLKKLIFEKKINVVKVGRLNRFRKTDLVDFVNSNLMEAQNGQA
ncbi:helix-turn-helix domain-containing protein [Halobacteriovorax sp.]|uniref:helix-turn-helix domain-containing protein n=1 Tax=Halobacteriovorax sp. TaxID=2020862 RepID=UPI003AF2A8C0